MSTAAAPSLPLGDRTSVLPTPSSDCTYTYTRLQGGKMVKGDFDEDTWYLPSTDIVSGEARGAL